MAKKPSKALQRKTRLLGEPFIRLVDIYKGERLIPGGVEALYRLLLERPEESNMVHSAMPTPEQHEYFVRRRPYREWFLIENKAGEHVGALYLTHRNEIGIAVLKAHQKKGYAFAAIRQVLRTIEPLPGLPAVRRPRYSANVAPGNLRSRALFEKLGGRLLQVTYEL